MMEFKTQAQRDLEYQCNRELLDRVQLTQRVGILITFFEDKVSEVSISVVDENFIPITNHNPTTRLLEEIKADLLKEFEMFPLNDHTLRLTVRTADKVMCEKFGRWYNGISQVRRARPTPEGYVYININ